MTNGSGATRRRLAQELGVVAGFEDPRAPLEQYHTPPDLAAHIVHVADLQGDIDDKTIVDLGCGTGMLALGAALRGPRRVVGLDVDPAPLSTARTNETRIGATADVSWIQADATRPPLRAIEDVTVLMNPPFGAQSGNEHTDRAFLETAVEVATVSYSVHNAGSKEFIEAFAEDNGGEITHGFGVEFEIPRQFDHHTEASETIDAEVFRIEWD
ncbi:MAG: METTL5 family protein [Natronomonas sp.]